MIDRFHFYATGDQGTILVLDNFPSVSMHGRELFIDVSGEPDEPINAIGFLGPISNEDSSSVGITRAQAIELRDWLDNWIAQTRDLDIENRWKAMLA